MIDTQDVGADVKWGTSRKYGGRAPLVPRARHQGLCGLPVHDQWDQRPHGFRVCPECAITWVSAIFPASPPRPTPRASDVVWP